MLYIPDTVQYWWSIVIMENIYINWSTHAILIYNVQQPILGISSLHCGERYIRVF